MPAKQIKRSRWLCGICKKSTATNGDSVLCEACVQWHHTTCLSISKKHFETFKSLKNLPYFCQNCRLSMEGKYDFCSAMMRLAQVRLDA